IWAVGAVLGWHDHTLILHWDGAQWHQTDSPNPNADDVLSAVAVVGPNDVWAVGGQGDISPEYGLILHWDGQHWTEVPNPSTIPSMLYAITALGPDNVWAVGTRGYPTVDSRTLILHWDGHTWT